ncbi:hypothetical protein EVAR_94522_1 [Eumeta japonica]|uniref:Uncharacterized protein n=1 Tax=Eumeta variegata TaxID=151549 RepID=A0A4C1UWP9_EUMVA|nr:hypothetical protein EVAR_94522_1 [Eumeta japonica]
MLRCIHTVVTGDRKRKKVKGGGSSGNGAQSARVRGASATSATADGLAPEGGPRKQKSFAYKLLKRGLAKSFAYKLLKRGLANLMSPTSTSGVAPPLRDGLYFFLMLPNALRSRCRPRTAAIEKSLGFCSK